MIQAKSTRTGTTVPNGVVASEATAGAAAEGASSSFASSSFIHRATGENSRGDYTYIRHLAIDGDQEPVVLVVAVPAGREDAGAEP